MIKMRYKMGYFYVFEGSRPGDIGAMMNAYEVEVEPGVWKTVAPFIPDPTNMVYTMGKRWLASQEDPGTPITEMD
jgi:hypothetical protein